jgi:hypothetical protein
MKNVTSMKTIKQIYDLLNSKREDDNDEFLKFFFSLKNYLYIYISSILTLFNW